MWLWDSLQLSRCQSQKLAHHPQDDYQYDARCIYYLFAMHFQKIPMRISLISHDTTINLPHYFQLCMKDVFHTLRLVLCWCYKYRLESYKYQWTRLVTLQESRSQKYPFNYLRLYILSLRLYLSRCWPVKECNLYRLFEGVLLRLVLLVSTCFVPRPIQVNRLSFCRLD